MITQMIVNRTKYWFQIEDLKLDSCALAMNFLMRLSTRQKRGFIYDRIKLPSQLLDRKSSEAMSAVDEAIVILASRNLVCFESRKTGTKNILITEAGIRAFKEYEELMKNAN